MGCKVPPRQQVCRQAVVRVSVQLLVWCVHWSMYSSKVLHQCQLPEQSSCTNCLLCLQEHILGIECPSRTFQQLWAHCTTPEKEAGEDPEGADNLYDQTICMLCSFNRRGWINETEILCHLQELEDANRMLGRGR